MKKYILMLAVASTAALVACGGNKEAQAEEAPAEEAVEVVEEAVEVVDSNACCGDSVCAAADSTATVAE